MDVDFGRLLWQGPLIGVKAAGGLQAEDGVELCQQTHDALGFVH